MYLYQVGHGKVHDFVFPCQFQYNIGTQQIVALQRGEDKWMLRYTPDYIVGDLLHT